MREPEPLNQMCPVPSWTPSHTKAISKWTLSLATNSHLPTTEGVAIQNALREPQIVQLCEGGLRKEGKSVPPAVVPTSAVTPGLRPFFQKLLWVMLSPPHL